MLIAEGFGKEPAVRYGEHLKTLQVTMQMLRSGTIRAQRVNTGASIAALRASSLGLPPKATGGNCDVDCLFYYCTRFEKALKLLEELQDAIETKNAVPKDAPKPREH